VAKAEIHAGICGFTTVVEATMDGKVCILEINSDCEAVRKLARNLSQVEPFQEISFRGVMPRTIEMGIAHCAHAACPVPVGIIKAVEVAARLALPQDVSIRLSPS